MTLSNNYRWVLIGDVSLKNINNAPANAPVFNIQEVIDILNDRCTRQTISREYAKQSKKMWISHVDSSNAEYFKILLHVGDKNATDVSFVDFETLAARDVEKQENEGGQFSSHIVIKKAPSTNGRYLIFIEKVPHIHLASIGGYLTWACRLPEYYKEADDDEGNKKKYRPIIEVLGYQSITVRKALQEGVLQDLELVSNTVHPQGLDEDPLIKEEVSSLKLTVKQSVSEEQAKSIFSQTKNFILEKFGNNSKPDAYIRIKAPSGQTKKAQIDIGQPDSDEDSEHLLEQGFVLNEKISEFSPPLGQRHVRIREDVFQKMTGLISSDSLDTV